MAGGLATFASALAKPQSGSTPDAHNDCDADDLKKRNRDILIAAQIAEALAVTTYSNLIDLSPFFQHIPSDDRGYLVAAREEEMSHYLLEQQVTDQFVTVHRSREHVRQSANYA